MKLKIFFAAGIVVTAMALSSCSKTGDFGNTNINPGTTVTPVTSGLLTNTLSGLSNYTWDRGGITTLGGLYCQYYSETQYTDASSYSRQTPDWDGFYAGSGVNPPPPGAGSLYDLQTIINYNSDPATAPLALINGSNNNQIAVARILKAYIFSVLTDSYGDIPYSGALKGDNGIVVFDKQQDIYTDLFKELTEAVAMFDGGIALKGDILFGGDITKWKKFANSLHALLALNLSKVDPTTGKAEFNAALNPANGGVIGSGEDITLTAPGGNFFNPVYQYYIITARLDYAVSKTVTDYLSTNKDDRINAYAETTLGFPYGLTRTDAVAFNNANPKWAKLMLGDSSSASAATKPFNIITAAEIDLARAEAAQLGWTTESASKLYYDGIKDSWTSWGIYNDSAYNAFILQPNIALTSGTEIQKIATQEWITHYPAGTRGWSVWRRTGYPVLTPAPGATTPIIPRRLSYGLHEYSTNPDNVKAAAAQYSVNGNTDSQLGRMWWDKE